ncbi:hypothetical protein K438DRAFT_416792 [Mycena galopus ATCC 62051]|nr:hypothetical protein K438DRAFT_416792 [Mycena galopus ATCC 62051]
MTPSPCTVCHFPPSLTQINQRSIGLAHKDSSFTTPPVSVTNLESYRIHRQNYLNQVSGVSASGASNFSTQYYSTGSTLHPHMQSTSTQGTFNIGNMNSPTFNLAYSQNGYPGYNPMSPQAAPFNTLASQPVVVPAGFTETHPSAQGWWRNPTTGWFWSSTQGLLPPASGRGFGA